MALMHVTGCWVCRETPSGQNSLGVVQNNRKNGAEHELSVYWPQEQRTSTVNSKQVRCGFQNGMDVIDRSPNAAVRSLGRGVIMQYRQLAGHEQLLVDFPDSGEKHWLPYQYLEHIYWAKHRFLRQQSTIEADAEKLRLRMLAQAIRVWNENTGALSQLDIEPLPHQIHLVHHILASGNYNWLIADDVGLGKTIETGMLLHALQQRGLAKRVLLITPAGLTRQWQEELYHKFGLDEFEIYGEDFHINETRHWKMHDFVIGSIDRFKQEDHLQSLLGAEPWDLVIFDEAHRLSRRQYGMKLDSSERYELAKSLRSRTENMLLLTATPHQGMQDKFVALLELIRPERRNDLLMLNMKPQILQDMVFRNHKADVTDAEGNFIFQGKTTNVLQVPSSSESISFDRTLQDYLKRGYSAGEQQGRTGRAIGFVMTVYRKLATSSAAAIHRALCNRLERLKAGAIAAKKPNEDMAEERYLGEWEESLITAGDEFFAGEISLLETLIEEAATLKSNDQKIMLFLDAVIAPILQQNPDEKVLIFTEYRTTQDYLKKALSGRYGISKVDLINGSMPHPERRAAIANFESSGQFLVSTEAGGEGINLQRNCHIMINYDLPWNPMRLVQRIGRLYRYGQKKRVVVFNIKQTDSLDQKIINLMYDRIESVVNDLAQVQKHEFNEGLKDEILGDLVELVDIEEILNDASQAGMERTEERIQQALQQAREAAGKQQALFDYAATSNPDEYRDELVITTAHLISFVEGMFEQLGIEIAERTHKGRIYKIVLPESVAAQLGKRPGSSARMEVTLDRILAAARPDTHMLDLNSSLMQYLLETALDYRFGGITATVQTPELGQGALLGTMLRWQSPQGRRKRQEFALIHSNAQGARLNPDAAQRWLLEPAAAGQTRTTRETTTEYFKRAEHTANLRMAAVCNDHLVPENIDWTAACWISEQ